MPLHRERGFALLVGIHFTPWMYVQNVRARWIVLWFGPWRYEIEIIRDMEEHV